MAHWSWLELWLLLLNQGRQQYRRRWDRSVKVSPPCLEQDFWHD